MSDLTTLEETAIDYARRGDFGTEAQRINEEITRLAPANQGAWTRLARCCMELRQLDAAAAALDQALALNPQNTIARSLQGEVTKRRASSLAVALPPRARAPRSRPAGKTPAIRKPRATHAGSKPLAGFGRPEFAALGHLTPDAAVEALGAGVESLLVALNDRPFAESVVEARNRSGHAGNWLFRRNTVHAGGAGHIYAFHHGGRWEPQINVGVFASSAWQRDAVRAGIGFNLSPGGADSDSDDAGHERVLGHFEQFQRLVSTRWRRLLTGWMGANGGFIQYGDRPPATDLLPDAAVDRLIEIQDPTELGWVFCGRWLFMDRPDDVETLVDGGRLVRWMEQAFSDLLPLWMDVYRRMM